jgi:hypothetical protein
VEKQTVDVEVEEDAVTDGEEAGLMLLKSGVGGVEKFERGCAVRETAGLKGFAACGVGVLRREVALAVAELFAEETNADLEVVDRLEERETADSKLLRWFEE